MTLDLRLNPASFRRHINTSTDVRTGRQVDVDLGDNCKFFIWGGISSDIRSEILFYGDASAEP